AHAQRPPLRQPARPCSGRRSQARMSLADLPTPASGWAFFLDVDGTLLEHAEHPQAVRVSAELRELLERLLAVTGGAVALISGRSVEDVERLFAPLAVPVAGQHGTERRSADRVLHRPAPPRAQR